MISRTLARPDEATVPPVPDTWKKSGSLNSHASVVCATNTVSSERYSRRSPWTTQKKKVLASLRSRSDMLPETSSMKNTTACTAGWRRLASCRQRRSSSMKVGGGPGALPGALALLGAAQAEVIVLEHAHRHAHGAGAAVDDVAAGDDLGEVGAHRLADLLVVAQPVARAAREQLVPLGRACRLALAAVLT